MLLNVCQQDQITITGYEHKATAARDAIQAIVDELEEMVQEDITLDSRVHARIIGGRGKGIRKIMDEFKVRLFGRWLSLCNEEGRMASLILCGPKHSGLVCGDNYISWG